ncbi:MAG TPA: hypothetical protein VNZ57_03880 [Longimicrobiales bacterium]|nr:hypothetical protein [Longimicrobiales bacterium]
MNRLHHGAGAVALALLVAAPCGSAAARQVDPEDAAPGIVNVEDVPPELPAAVANDVVTFFNRPETIRIWGNAHIPPGTSITGDVGLLGGSLRVSGQIRGRVVVINGDARLEAGSLVDGDLVVVGGTVTDLGGSAVTGLVEAHPQTLRYRRERDQIVYTPLRSDPSLTAGRDLGFGRLDFTLRSFGPYNRVEGLPIAAGPTLELGRSNPTRLEALAVYRSTNGLRFVPREMGYRVRLEQAFGGYRAIRAGLLLYSEIAPIESWGLSTREASLATFVLHRDYRDYYERQGQGFFVAIGRPSSPTTFDIEYRNEKHHRVGPRSPWTLFGNNRPWRSQPSIDAGDFRSIAATFRYDASNATGDVSTGWSIQVNLERGLGGSLVNAARPDTLPALEAAEGPFSEEVAFTSAFIDLRRYARLGPYSRMALRAVAAGSVDGDALPAQRQLTLGGEGTLPGYQPFSFDCGARSLTIELDGELWHPYYGCDRLLLFQFEYETRLPIASGAARQLGWPLDMVDSPAGVIFLNAGRAWTEPDALNGRRRGQSDFSADFGVGIRIGPLGLYWARPLSGGSGAAGVNFFVRLSSRL